MNSTNLPKAYNITEALFTKIRQDALQRTDEVISDLLVKAFSPDSGRVIESVLQLMPDERFQVLEVLVSGNEDDPEIQFFASVIVMKLAVHQNYTIANNEEYILACRSFMQLVSCEGLRRKGMLEYLWPENLFDIAGSKEGFMKLTDKGIESNQTKILESFTGTKQ